VSNEGIVRTAEEEDNYLEMRGPLRKYQNQIGCVQDIVRYRANSSAIPADTGVITGKCNCMCVMNILLMIYPFKSTSIAACEE